MANIFEKINTLTVGQQASLRRSAGKSLDEVDAGALQAFFSSVAPQKPYDQEKAFTVACIACLWQQEERSNAVSFAKCLQRLRSSKGDSTEGVDSRFRSLIDTPWNDDDLPHVCGGEPTITEHSATNCAICPTCVGVNRA